eukprot:971579_1
MQPKQKTLKRTRNEELSPSQTSLPNKEKTLENAESYEPIAKKRLISPHDYLLDICQGTVKASLSMQSFFHEYTETEKDSYDNEVCKAVRSLNLDEIKTMHSQGRTFQCSNRFGESLIHMACRRGSSEVVNFLVEEAGVSIKCCDDFGRTPFHDACWSSIPNFDLIELLIEICPSMLLMCDKRGHTPLQYTRREHWATWVTFLGTQKSKKK